MDCEIFVGITRTMTTGRLVCFSNSSNFFLGTNAFRRFYLVVSEVPLPKAESGLGYAFSPTPSLFSLLVSGKWILENGTIDRHFIL